MIFTSFVSLKHCITPFAVVKYDFNYCALKTVSTQALEFPHASVYALWRYRTCHCTSDSATATISSDADSMKFVTIFLRVNRCVWLRRTRTCNSLAFAKRVPYYTISQYKPSLFIKPEATGNGCDDYFWKESCFCNRSTWKMKKMWLVRMTRFGRALYEFWVRCLLPIGLHPHIAGASLT